MNLISNMLVIKSLVAQELMRMNYCTIAFASPVADCG